jgi:RNA polymerase sigma factor (sigma-70 family)
VNVTEPESPASLEELYALYSQSVFRICLRYTRNEEDAEDLVHEVFMKVNAHLGEFEGRSTVFTWIYRVSVNECLSWLRSRKRRKADVEWIEELEPSSAEQDEIDTRLLVQKLMGWTDAKTREILFMAYLEGLKQEEIARVLNLSRRAVSKRLMVFREKVARLRERVKP